MLLGRCVDLLQGSTEVYVKSSESNGHFLKKYNVKIRKDKSVLFLGQITYLCSIVSKDGIRISP